jgi:hypothetical protein
MKDLAGADRQRGRDPTRTGRGSGPPLKLSFVPAKSRKSVDLVRGAPLVVGTGRLGLHQLTRQGRALQRGRSLADRA